MELKMRPSATVDATVTKKRLLWLIRLNSALNVS